MTSNSERDVALREATALVPVKRLYGAAPRRVRIAAAGYLVVLVFAAGTGIARLAGADLNPALIIGALVATPLLVSLLGDRITGVKAFSIEISLSDVSVPVERVEGDFTGAVMEVVEMGGSAAPDLRDSIQSARAGRWKLLRVNLRSDDYWWSTRVFLVAALAMDYADIEALVFVRSREERIFVGIASPFSVRARLGAQFPDYEVAYRRVRSEVVSEGIQERDQEVNDILGWRWTAAFKPSESEVKQIVTTDDLKRWLTRDDLDDESLPYGPLNPLLRYRIATRPYRYSALTDGTRLVAIVDRDELARRTAVADLEQRLG